jgi:hypothetical protein
MTEADDPYNLNADGSPEWKDIINKDDAINCKNFAGDVTTTGVYSMSGFTNDNPDFTIPDSCGDSCDFPFQVHKTAEGTFEICPGMVNNQVPTNMNAGLSVENGFIYLVVNYSASTKAFPATGGVSLATGGTVPDSTKSVSYVAVAQVVDGSVDQLIGGSLWGDRIQVGAGATETAYYYYAQV